MTLTTKRFIEKATLKHGNKYDYSKVEYNGCNEKVNIICPEHGEFLQKPTTHLLGCGCPICGKEKSSKPQTKETWIKKARKVHGNKYDYSNVKYINHNTHVSIICPEHGEFSQKPITHLRGNGCPECGKLKCMSYFKYKTTEQFIKDARKVHGDKYDYSKVEYVNSKQKV